MGFFPRFFRKDRPRRDDHGKERWVLGEFVPHKGDIRSLLQSAIPASRPSTLALTGDHDEDFLKSSITTEDFLYYGRAHSSKTTAVTGATLRRILRS